MKIQRLFFIILCLLLSSCVQRPMFKNENSALIKSNYPIIEINGEKIAETYQLDLKAGENAVLILYNTYQYNYFCRFEWQAKAGNAYEVTDQENQYPLTLYHWRKKNRLWAIRLNPIKAKTCQKQAVPESTLD